MALKWNEESAFKWKLSGVKRGNPHGYWIIQPVGSCIVNGVEAKKQWTERGGVDGVKGTGMASKVSQTPFGGRIRTEEARDLVYPLRPNDRKNFPFWPDVLQCGRPSEILLLLRRLLIHYLENLWEKNQLHCSITVIKLMY